MSSGNNISDAVLLHLISIASYVVPIFIFAPCFFEVVEFSTMKMVTKIHKCLSMCRESILDDINLMLTSFYVVESAVKSFFKINGGNIEILPISSPDGKTMLEEYTEYNYN